jgi:hypothetical protein
LLLSHGKKFEPIVLQVVGLAGGLIVTLPMWANAVVLLPHLAISNMDMSNTLNFIGAARNDFFDGPPNSIGISWSFINADLSALFPFPYVHQFSTTHDLHLQVGIAVAAAFLLSIMYRREKQTSALQILVATSIALAASVFHLLPFWRFMPQPLTIIQIPFRLLVFATVFGSLLVGSIMQRLSADRRVGLYGFMLVCLIAHLFVFNYRPNVGPRPEVAFGNATLVSHDYQELDGKPSTRALVQASFSTTERWPGNCLVGSVTASADGGVKFPIAYGRRLAVTLDDVQSQIFASNDAHLVVEMSEGEHRATVCRSEPIPVIPYYVAMLVLASVGCGIIVWRRRRELRSKSVSSGLEAPQPGQIGYP